MSDSNTEQPPKMGALLKKMETLSGRHKVHPIVRGALIATTTLGGMALDAAVSQTPPPHNESTGHTIQVPGLGDRFKGIYDPKAAYADTVSAQGVQAPLPDGSGVSIPEGAVNFDLTGYSIDGVFKNYWYLNGDLPQQGYPISPVMSEKSLIDGKTYQVQYFERSKMEYHPENDPDQQVLLELFGVEEYYKMYPKDKFPQGAPGQITDDTVGAHTFPETGKTLGDTLSFMSYWNNNGGLAQFGYPISDPFEEKQEDGKIYKVQYFERAKFESHPENMPPNDVLLSRIGAKFLNERYQKNANNELILRPVATATATPEAATATPTPEATEGTLTLEVPYKGGNIKFYVQDKGAQFIDKENRKADITTLFDGFYDMNGYTGNLDLEIISLPRGSLDFDHIHTRTYTNGKTIYSQGGNTSLGKEFEWYSTDMEMQNNKGIMYFAMQDDSAGNNMALLTTIQNTPDGDRVSAAVEISILNRYSHIDNTPGVFFSLITDHGRTDLLPLMGGDSEGNFDGGARVPLRLLPPLQ